MAENVYFHKVENGTEPEQIQEITSRLMDVLLANEDITLESKIPLKVHFGEKGNVTYLKPENYLGLIVYLEGKGKELCYIETSVLYGGQRYKKELHEKTALEHGFTQLPIEFADGEHGENYAEVKIDKKHFNSFKIGGAFLDYRQLLVLSHFKGHTLTGFGGAIKQLGMGCAAKGGKLSVHMGYKPRIKSWKCKRCNLCKTRCNEDALVIGRKSYIDHEKCIGCGACMAICPYNAITIFSLRGALKFLGIGNPLIEKLIEGAYAAQQGKRNIYMNFAMNITRGCDCEPRKMRPVMDDMGVFVSTDPVAVDKACFDMARERGRKFRGGKTFEYAQRIGLGSADYSLLDITGQSD